MNPTIHREFAQHTPEWFAAKAGKFSASKAAIVMGKLDTSGLASLLQDLAWERVYGPVEGGFQSAAMLRGIEMEDEASDWYAFERDVVLETVGFVEHATLQNVGWSPDRLRGERSAVEAKCPLHKAWMDCKRTGLVPSEYRWQCRWAMWVGELESLDFVAYHPKAGGLIVPCEVTDSEREQMAERVAMLEPKVQTWVDIITDKRSAA